MTRQFRKQPIAITRRTAMKGFAATAGVAAIGVASPAIIRSARAADPIRVGVLSPVTGAWTVYGQAHSRGFELAVEEINAAGGAGGRPIEMILADYQTDQRLVVEQANRLIRQEKVDLLAGTFSSADRNAAGPVVKAADKILLYPTWYEGQIKDYYPGVCNPNIFMFGPEPTQQVWPFMEYMVNKFGKKFYMIGSDYAWPRVTNLFTKERLQELGGEAVAEVYIPFNTPQYESVLRDIRDKKPDIIFHSLTGSDTVNFRQQFAAAGMKEDFLIWTVDDEEVVTSGLGPDVSSGAYVSFDYFMTITHPNNKAFLERYRAKYGPDALMNTVGVGMYNAGHMLALAVAKAGSVETAALRAALKELEFDKAPQGEIKMRGLDNQIVVPSYLMKVRDGWTSVNDMFEEVQSVPLVEPKDARCDLPL